jgi:hypothetical protein
MITFLPSSNFIESANCLDWQWAKNRLSNQVDEGIVIVQILLGERPKSNHPTVLMWENSELTLVDYTWTHLYTRERKRKLTDITRRIELNRLQLIAVEKDPVGNKPFWLGDERLHSSHRSILLGKNPSWYSQFGWEEKPAVRGSDARWPYWWPVSKNNTEVVK